MTPVIPTIIMIIAAVIFVGSLIISHHASYQLGKSEGYLTVISKFLGSCVTNSIMCSDSSPLHKEERSEKKVEEAKKEKKVQTSSEENIKNAIYSGVIHKFARDGITKERPVMTYDYMGEKKFFEYNENRKVVRISGKERECVLAALEGRKIRNYKKYEINMPEKS